MIKAGKYGHIFHDCKDFVQFRVTHTTAALSDRFILRLSHNFIIKGVNHLFLFKNKSFVSTFTLR